MYEVNYKTLKLYALLYIKPYGGICTFAIYTVESRYARERVTRFKVFATVSPS